MTLSIVPEKENLDRKRILFAALFLLLSLSLAILLFSVGFPVFAIISLSVISAIFFSVGLFLLIKPIWRFYKKFYFDHYNIHVAIKAAFEDLRDTRKSAYYNRLCALMGLDSLNIEQLRRLSNDEICDIRTTLLGIKTDRQLIDPLLSKLDINFCEIIFERLRLSANAQHNEENIQKFLRLLKVHPVLVIGAILKALEKPGIGVHVAIVDLIKVISNKMCADIDNFQRDVVTAYNQVIVNSQAVINSLLLVLERCQDQTIRENTANLLGYITYGNSNEKLVLRPFQTDQSVDFLIARFRNAYEQQGSAELKRGIGYIVTKLIELNRVDVLRELLLNLAALSSVVITATITLLCTLQAKKLLLLDGDMVREIVRVANSKGYGPDVCQLLYNIVAAQKPSNPQISYDSLDVIIASLEIPAFQLYEELIKLPIYKKIKAKPAVVSEEEGKEPLPSVGPSPFK